jgi:hypothetical protein
MRREGLSLRNLVVLAGLVGVVCAAACGGDDGVAEAPACLDDLELDCSPSIPATFDSLYSNIVQPSCGGPTDTPSCHSAGAKQGGLDLSAPARAYDALLGKRGKARVLPGDPECSLLMLRIEADDDTFRMPLGTERMAPGLRCAVQQWIAEGAER